MHRHTFISAGKYPAHARTPSKHWAGSNCLSKPSKFVPYAQKRETLSTLAPSSSCHAFYQSPGQPCSYSPGSLLGLQLSPHFPAWLRVGAQLVPQRGLIRSLPPPPSTDFSGKSIPFCACGFVLLHPCSCMLLHHTGFAGTRVGALAHGSSARTGSGCGPPRPPTKPPGGDVETGEGGPNSAAGRHCSQQPKQTKLNPTLQRFPGYSEGGKTTTA